MTILESQQDEFIIKLKQRMPAFTRSKYDFDEAIHVHSVVDFDCDELEEKMNDFCVNLTDKYYGGYLPDEFMNYKIGKVGEESVKEYLGKLISNVDYEFYEWGDDEKFFYLTSNTSVNLQVKTTCFDRILEKDIDYEKDEAEYFYGLYQDYVNLEHDKCKKILDTIKWNISEKEQNQSQVCIFVLLLNQVVGDRMPGYVDIDEIDKEIVSDIDCVLTIKYCEYNAIYSSILCGFKPKNLLKPNTDIYLKDLFYIGGLKGYLKHFT
ncbi:MAG: hypothetical protein F6K24_11310 [Okeania sp. SIO2D1]|nr:hypothetical protein [Okeania sp. SIO2D1]